MGEDGIVIGTEIDTSGFKAGTDSIKSACNSLVNSIRASFQKIAGAVGNIAGKGFGVLGKNAKSSMQAVNASANNLLRTFTRMLPAMIGIRGAFGILQRGANSFLSQNRQLQNQLNACWTAIGNVIGPIIEMLVGLLSNLISYLITFLHLIGLSSKSASDAAKKTGAAAGAMQKSLMGFDEINKLSDGGGGGGSGSLVDPEMPATLQKLGDALKLLMEDLKKTWKEAWDENGRGEKMMQSLKTLMSDIVDLAAEFVLAFDRAWMNADNGKKIFANIMEIITHLANGMDKIVVAMRDWVKETEWFNTIVEDVRLIFDQLNGISEVLDEKIAPILASKIGKWLDTVSQGIHTALGDIEKIAGNVKGMLESPQGLKMVDSLCEMFISMQKVGWAAVDLVLGSFAKLDMSSYATYATKLSDAIKTAADKVSELLGNQKLQTTIALLMDIAWAATASALSAIADAIGDIANYINGLDWDEINTGLEKLKENINIGDAEGIGTSLGELLNLALDNVPWDSLGDTLAGWINYAVDVAKGFVHAFDEEGLAKNLATFLNDVVTTTDWDSVGSTIGEGIGKAIKFLTTLLTNINGSELAGAFLSFTEGLFNALTDAIGEIHWDEVGAKIGEFFDTIDAKSGKLGEALKKLAKTIINALIDAILYTETDESREKVKNWLADFFKGPEWVFDLVFGINPVVDDDKWLDYNEEGISAVVANHRKRLQKLVDEFGEDQVIEAAYALGFNVKSENISYDQFNDLKAKLQEMALEAATSFTSSFENQLAELGVSGQDAEDYLREFNETVEQLGQPAGEQYAERVIESIKGKKADLEAGLATFAESLSNSEVYEFPTKTQERLKANYEEVFNRLGKDAADAYAEGVLSGDVFSRNETVDQFIARYAESLENADKKPLEDAAKESMASPMTEAIAEKIEERTSVEEIGASVGSALVEAGAVSYEDANTLGTNLVAGFIDGIASKIEGAGGLVETVSDAISKSLQAGDDILVTWYTSTLTMNLGEIVSAVLGAVQEISESIYNTASEMYSSSISFFNTLYSDVYSVFNGLSRDASHWGWDMMNSLASGIWSGYSNVRHAVSAVADMIASYLGFSEPDVGPLSNFHTFMPDMMKEMAYGINSNIGYPEAAIQNVAGMLAGNMNLGMPAFAMGSVVPYSVGGSSRSTQEDQMMQFADLMQQSMFQAFTAALQNQSKEQNGWNVYLDGKQISDSVTKWQRRDDRANGR